MFTLYHIPKIFSIHWKTFLFYWVRTRGGCNCHISGRACNSELNLILFGKCLDIEVAKFTILHICVSTLTVPIFRGDNYTLFLWGKCRNMMIFAEDIPLHFTNWCFPTYQACCLSTISTNSRFFQLAWGSRLYAVHFSPKFWPKITLFATLLRRHCRGAVGNMISELARYIPNQVNAFLLDQVTFSVRNMLK